MAKSQGLIYTPIAQSGWPHCFVRNIIKLYEPWRLHEHLQYLLHKPLLSTWRRPCPWVSLSSPVKKEVRINQFNDMECYTFQLSKSDFQILWQSIECLEMTTPWLLLWLCDLRNELKTSLYFHTSDTPGQKLNINMSKNIALYLLHPVLCFPMLCECCLESRWRILITLAYICFIQKKKHSGQHDIKRWLYTYKDCPCMYARNDLR